MKGLPPPLVRPLLLENPVTVQVLGICSALAVTTTLATSLVMCAALTFVLVGSNVTISFLRHWIPHATRLMIQITLIATLVIVSGLVLEAIAPAMSRRLSIFVGLIVTNCIVLGRAETFAMRHGPVASFWDGLGNALGYSLILTLVGATRELLGSGSLLGARVFTSVAEGGAFRPVELFLLPPSAFFLIAFLVWAIHGLRRRLEGEGETSP